MFITYEYKIVFIINTQGKVFNVQMYYGYIHAIYQVCFWISLDKIWQSFE